MNTTVEVLCLDGLEAAVIGHTTRDGETEVLVYDAAMVDKLLTGLGYVDFDVYDFEQQLIEHKGLSSNKRPIFVFLDKAIQDKIIDLPFARRKDSILH
jgi:hypothetical protein